MSGHPWVEPDLPVDGLTPCGASINATIQGMKAGQALMLPVGSSGVAKYDISDAGIVIDRSIRFGSIGAPRSSADNTDPDIGAQLLYNATTGDALTVRPPNTTDSRIGPHLQNLLVVGNKNVVGAVSGGGIVLNGRNLPRTAINGFSLENVHATLAKGDGVTVWDQVYEGRIVGMYSTDNGGKGFVSAVPAGGLPGEILMLDLHTHDNGGNGVELRGGGSWSYHHLSSSRNAGSALNASGVQLSGFDIQAESNTGAQTIALDNMVRGVLVGINVAYPASYAGVGVDFTNAATRNIELVSSFFTGSCLYDIRNVAGQQGIKIDGYYQSAASKTSLVAGTALLQIGLSLVGNLVLTGKFNPSDDVTLGAGASFIMTGKWQVGSDGRPKWLDAGNTQTTVGAAGGASALPATPTKFFHVRDSAGTILVIPAYASA